MAYKNVLAENVTSEFFEKKSKFIAYCSRVSTEDAARDYIAKIKKLNWSATHNIYAYQIGDNNEIQRCSDDGEPSGTAGKPVLEIIKSEGLSDCIIVVTRYFGGILLGTGGLVRAYGKTAQLAVQNAKKTHLSQGKTVCLFMDYEILGKIEHYLIQGNYIIERIEYKNNAVIYCLIENEKVDGFCKKIKDNFSQGVDYTISNECKWIPHF